MGDGARDNSRRDGEARTGKPRHYAVTGSKILELAKNAHNLFVQQNSQDQARLLKTLVSNCTFDRGSLLATYRKPFDMLVEGNENGNWLGGRDSNPDNLLQRQMSYRWTTSQYQPTRATR